VIPNKEKASSKILLEPRGRKRQDNIFTIYIAVVITILATAIICTIILNFLMFSEYQKIQNYPKKSQEDKHRRKPDRFVANIYDMYPYFFEDNNATSERISLVSTTTDSD
jgi:predicted PurR-regulated permease PerM